MPSKLGWKLFYLTSAALAAPSAAFAQTTPPQKPEADAERQSEIIVIYPASLQRRVVGISLSAKY